MEFISAHFFGCCECQCDHPLCKLGPYIIITHVPIRSKFEERETHFQDQPFDFDTLNISPSMNVKRMMDFVKRTRCTMRILVSK